MVRRTWGLRGQTPVIESTGSWRTLSLAATLICTPAGRKPKLFLKVVPGPVRSEDILRYVKELKRHHPAKKLLLIWDGLPAHRSKVVKEFLQKQSFWLKVVRFPAYAPELNPPEYLWSAMKTADLANLPSKGLSHMHKAVIRSRNRIRRDKELLKGFLKASGLYD